VLRSLEFLALWSPRKDVVIQERILIAYFLFRVASIYCGEWGRECSAGGCQL
jgi:hypothetical protein